MEIVRLKLTPDVVTPPSQRWDEINDEVQITPDGGATWYPDPALDPRTSSVYRQPERTGTDPKCDAATDMALTLQALVNTTIDTIGTVQTANAILAIIVVFTPGFGWLVRLVLALVEAILAKTLGIVTVVFRRPCTPSSISLAKTLYRLSQITTRWMDIKSIHSTTSGISVCAQTATT